MLYAGITVYVIGAVASTRAESLSAFVVCRVVWGFGAACPRSLALAILRDTFEGDRMARVMSNVMATFILVPIVAPSVGSVPPRGRELAAHAVAPGRRSPWSSPPGSPSACPRRSRWRSAARWRRARLLGAAGAVVRNRQTMAFCVASTFLFGIMTSYVGSTQVIVEEVFGEEDLFPFIFGALAIGLALRLAAGRPARHPDRARPPRADRRALRRRLRRRPRHHRRSPPTATRRCGSSSWPAR